jgi:hypothetical protein
LSLRETIWGRDELEVGEMWNSNSVTLYLLARRGMRVESIRPPAGGRAPGWEAGIFAARWQQWEDHLNTESDELRGVVLTTRAGVLKPD